MLAEHDEAMTNFPVSSESLAPFPAVKEPDRYGIAIVGAGDIVTSAHLPAYQKMGYRVSGLFDIDQDRAQRAAADFGVPHVYRDLDALLSDDTVNVVDIAVPPWAQETMVEQIARAGRHLLCQKPLAVQAARGAQLVATAEQAGVQLAVNVNMRWSPAIRTLKQLIDRDSFGQLTRVQLQINFWDTWETWPWLADVDELLIRYDAIHLIDSLRYLFGEPESVYGTASYLPNHTVRGETDVVLVYRYAAGFTAVIHDNANNWAEDTAAEFRVEGSAGMAKGILGVWYDYPVGRADRVDFCTRSAPGQWATFAPPGRWVPDAWAWTMAELFAAIDEDRAPIHNGGDHVRTLELVEKTYQSVHTREEVGCEG